MRRREKEIKEKTAIEAVIRNSVVCRLAISVDNQPYLVPMCFGYKDDTLYFHSAKEGKKIDALRRNNKLCFEFDINVKVLRGDNACHWGMQYQSVMGFGRAIFIEEEKEKHDALHSIMGQYSSEKYEFSGLDMKSVEVFKVEIEQMTGKQSGFDI